MEIVFSDLYGCPGVFSGAKHRDIEIPGDGRRTLNMLGVIPEFPLRAPRRLIEMAGARRRRLASSCSSSWGLTRGLRVVSESRGIDFVVPCRPGHRVVMLGAEWML